MNNAGIALRKIRDMHKIIVSLDSSNTDILNRTRDVEAYIHKASRDTNKYRKRLTSTYEILEKRKLDFAITNGLEEAGLDKDMIEDLMLSRHKPIDKAQEHLREYQQQVVDISVPKRDLVSGTKQLEAQLTKSSEKITLYERVLSDVMTFLGRKGLLQEELLEALNGSKMTGKVVNQILELQKQQQ